jgi:hypothetical protein
MLSDVNYLSYFSQHALCVRLADGGELKWLSPGDTKQRTQTRPSIVSDRPQ